MLSGKQALSLFIIALLFFFVPWSAPAARADQSRYQALKGVEAVQSVFDFKIGNPRMAAFQLELIHKTFQDPNLTIGSKKPQFTVIFFGPATKLVSTARDGFDPQERKQLAKIAGIVSAMAEDGIRLEICMIAAHGNHVAPATILPEIHPVPNGWVSLIGYQRQGYALVPNF